MFGQLNIVYPLLISIFLFLVVFVITKIVKYEKTLKEKNLNIIQLYLDKKFLHNNLTSSFKAPKPQNYAESFLENIKIYFKLDDIRVISRKELAKDEELRFLFKDKLEKLATEFLSEAKKDIEALHEILCDEDANSKKEHRLYVYMLSDQAKKQDTQNLIYVKSPYKFSKNELETLDIYVHLAQLLNTNAE